MDECCKKYQDKERIIKKCTPTFYGLEKRSVISKMLLLNYHAEITRSQRKFLYYLSVPGDLCVK
jgi:hypothetical protein